MLVRWVSVFGGCLIRIWGGLKRTRAGMKDAERGDYVPLRTVGDV